MDLLTGLLVGWVALVTVLYFGLQKLLEWWPNALDSLRATQSHKVPLADRHHLETSEAKLSQPQSFNQPSHSSEAEEMKLGKDQQHNNSAWLNEVITWLYRYYRTTPEFITCWIRSLNEASKKVATSVGCDLVFEEICAEGVEPPQIFDIKTEPGPRDHLTIKGSIVCPQFAIRLVSSQHSSEGLRVTNYEAILGNLSGGVQSRLACIANELFIMACFDGRPEFDLELRTFDNLSAEECVDGRIVEEALRKCLITAVTNLSRDVPQQVEDVFRRLNSTQMTAASNVVLSTDKFQASRLLVKLIRAQKLGANEIVHQPYTIVELDEPSQKHTSSLGLNVSPVWEEQFLFDLSTRSEEILFEIYDKVKEGDPKFLGLAIVGIEELRHSPSSVQVLTLQSRPYQNDKVSGTLTVEFQFLEQFDSPRLPSRTENWELSGLQAKSQPDGTFNTKTATAVRPLTTATQQQQPVDNHVVTPIKTTSVLIKSVSQYFQVPEGEEQAGDKKVSSTSLIGFSEQQKINVTKENGVKPDKILIGAEKTQAADANLLKLPSASHTVAEQSSSPPPSTSASTSDGPDVRSRSRDRPSTFFGDLRSRLSFGKAKGRGISLDRPNDGVEPLRTGSRSVSTPPTRDSSEPRRSGHRGKSPLDSTSELSTVSTESVYYQSTLVVEATENNVKKYYLIPPNMIQNPVGRKLMKKGTKLHIFNEHTFSAVRIRGSVSCVVCSKPIQRTFGKQAYQCRDCKVTVHKRCHFKIDSKCLDSHVSNLEMEYVWVTER